MVNDPAYLGSGQSPILYSYTILGGSTTQHIWALVNHLSHTILKGSTTQTIQNLGNHPSHTTWRIGISAYSNLGRSPIPHFTSRVEDLIYSSTSQLLILEYWQQFFNYFSYL